MSHCNCCLPICPVPVLETESKDSTGVKWGISRWGNHYTSEVYEDHWSGSSLHNTDYNWGSEPEDTVNYDVWNSVINETLTTTTTNTGGSACDAGVRADVRTGGGTSSNTKKSVLGSTVWITDVDAGKSEVIANQFEDTGTSTEYNFDGTVKATTLNVGPSLYHSNLTWGTPVIIDTETETEDFYSKSYTMAGYGWQLVTNKTTWSGKVTDAMLIASNITCTEGEEWSSGGSSAKFSQSFTTHYRQPDPILSEVYHRQMRFRFKIPFTFDPPPSPHPQKWHGTYQSIDYQTVFTPADHDPANPEVSPKVIAPGNVEWAGPGDLADDDSWVTAWIEIDPPAVEGEITVELLRSKCRHSMAMVEH